MALSGLVSAACRNELTIFLGKGVPGLRCTVDGFVIAQGCFNEQITATISSTNNSTIIGHSEICIFSCVILRNCVVRNFSIQQKDTNMIKIGIVDDHAIVRSGLKQFFSDQVDLRVVGEAGSGREAIDLVRNVELDILVMDLSMPGQSGIDALAMIRAKAPDVGILILSGYPEEHYAVNLIRQGASGYLNKECDPSEIVDAIRVISLGKRYITPAVAELLAQQLNRPNDVASHEQLSEREFQVFLKLAKGETAGDIAKALSLSVKTVSTYRTRVMEKMSLASNSDLTYYALKNKLID